MQSLHAATERLGVDVCLTEGSGNKSAPCCPHGPMLLFERFYKDGRSARRFYACSAARDRKDCPFFQWEDEKVSEAREKAHKEIIEASRKPFMDACNTYKSILDGSSSKRQQELKCFFCHSCGLLLLSKHKEKHQAHDIEQVQDLSKPTIVLRPRENEKTQAQYLFSSKTSQFLISLLKKLGFKNVLCVGTPRLHEEIQSIGKSSDEEAGKLDSLLLDIDYRYAQFFPSSKFCWYNMFNHFFFGNQASEKTFQEFVKREGVVLIMDPPFGGLAEVLAATVNKIWSTWRQEVTQDMKEEEELPTVWIFPYFMEPHVKTALPSLIMLDYKVDYDNHPHFKSRNMKGSKRGSPVRIFTNITPAEVVLPADEGYRFCKSCTRYVAAENVHCRKCDGCMSKDGRQYVHCDICGTCVKPGRQHCMTCGRCEEEGHRCDKSVNSACHICGEEGHKRRDCPSRPLEPPKKRRKQVEGVRLGSTAQRKASNGKHTKAGPRKLQKKKKTK